MDCGQVTATRRLSGTDRCAISSTLRRAALEKMFEPPIPNFSKVEKVENGTKNSISVDEKVVSGQTCNGRLSYAGQFQP